MNKIKRIDICIYHKMFIIHWAGSLFDMPKIYTGICEEISCSLNIDENFRVIATEIDTGIPREKNKIFITNEIPFTLDQSLYLRKLVNKICATQYMVEGRGSVLEEDDRKLDKMIKILQKKANKKGSLTRDEDTLRAPYGVNPYIMIRFPKGAFQIVYDYSREVFMASLPSGIPTRIFENIFK